MVTSKFCEKYSLFSLPILIFLLVLLKTFKDDGSTLDYFTIEVKFFVKMQNYSSRFKIKQLPKNDIDSSDNDILPSAVILFFLLGNQDENIAKVVKKIIQKNGTVTVQGEILRNYNEISEEF